MMNTPIYLDYASTTPVHPDVADAMVKCLTLDGNFGNAASRTHLFGWKADEAVERARQQVATLISADPREIVWTSGATESNNLALKGVVDAALNSLNESATPNSVVRPNIVVSSIEHKAVLDAAAALAGRGVNLRYVKPNAEGIIEAASIEAAINEDTVLVSVMHANNETGVINPIEDIGKLCRGRGVLFHTDAAQTGGKLSLDVKTLNCDLLSLSAHKMYGPKGVGVLYVRRHPDVKITAQIHGGGHECGMRSGTLATHQVVGMGKAAELASEGLDAAHSKKMRDRFWAGIRHLEQVELNGSFENRLPGNLNISFSGIEGEMMLMSLQGLAISSGSACMSTSVEPSYVLKEMGLSERRADSALRFSFGRFTTEADIDIAIEHIIKTVASLSRASA